jgi:hypothetical protein
MLRIWLPLQEVGELSQTGEFRNIDKRKTNVKTELMIEGGGGMKIFTYIEGGYVFPQVFGRVWKYVLEISFILHPPLVITLWPVP